MALRELGPQNTSFNLSPLRSNSLELKLEAKLEPQIDLEKPITRSEEAIDIEYMRLADKIVESRLNHTKH